MGDAAAKITFYTELSNLLMLSGILLMALSIWMFFHFGAVRMIDRVTGIGAKRERARFLKEQEKRTGQVQSGNTYDGSDELEEMPVPEEIEQDADIGADAGPLHAGSIQQEEAGPTGEDEPDMSVWDNTSALREMFEKRDKAQKQPGAFVSGMQGQEQPQAQPGIQGQATRKAPARFSKDVPGQGFAETGLLADKTVYEPETDILKQKEREAGCANTFRIVNCIRESVALSEVQV